MKTKIYYLAIFAVALIMAACVKDEMAEIEEPEPPAPGTHTLIHYWHFNNVDGTVETIAADFSAIGDAVISYPGTGEGYLDSRTHRAADPVSNLNLRMGQSTDQGAVLRARNPSEGRILLIEAPSTGFTDLIVQYAISRSRPEVPIQQFYYSPDAGETWVAVGDLYEANDIPEWELISYNLSDVEEVNDNPGLQFKIEYSGEFISEVSGNNRYDNFTVDGISMGESVPEKLSILSVNNNEIPEKGEPFSVSLLVQNAAGLPTAVKDPTTVTLSLASGTGNLGGNLTGTIEAGSYELTITGITYDTAEQGVSIKARAEGLEEAISEEFEVKAFYELTLMADPEDAGVLSGEGSFEEGDEIELEAVANVGYEFVHWMDAEGGTVSEEPSFVFTMPAEDITLTAVFEESSTDKELIHYWHFSTLSVEENDFTGPVYSDFSAVGQGIISYPGTGEGRMDERTHRPADPVSNMNLRMGVEPDQGAVLRVRNPAEGRILLFEVPSTGFKNLEMTYAITRSSDVAGAQQFYYSPDAGTTWVALGDLYEAQDVPQWDLINFDLSHIEELNNNPNLQFKIEFSGDFIHEGSGNNRYDNITLDGVPL